MATLRKRMLIAAAIAALATVVAAGPASAAPNSAGQSTISLGALGFTADTVDVTDRPSGWAVGLKWTVVDRDAAATSIHGTIELRLFNDGEAVGPAKTYNWVLRPDNVADVFADHYWNATAQDSSYSLTFVVPQYGPAEQVTWRVTRLTASDDRGNSRTFEREVLSEYDNSVAVTELVDTANPELQAFGRSWPQLPVLFDNGGPLTLKYTLAIGEQAGFWKGKLKLAGPGGAEASASFELIKVNSYIWMCGDEQNYDNQWVWCGLSVALPSGSPAGVWRVKSLEITDTVGHMGTYSVDSSSSDVRTTRNEPLSASGFALSATEVNNWREDQIVRVSMLPAGAQGAITSVRLESNCYPQDTTPEVAPDGTVSVELVMATIHSQCSIGGIAIEDAAGNLALYGSYFGAPALDLVVTRMPDTVPPVALSASLPKSTWTQTELQNAWGIGIDVVVDINSPAPVTGFSTTIYDANGVSVGGAGGGIHEDADGHLSLSAHARWLPVGQYTIGFTLYDAAGNYAHYGYPNGVGNPLPNGPLVLTVTAG